MNAYPSAIEYEISCRELLRGATVGSGLALLLARAASGPVLAAAQTAGTKEFHGGLPYEVPPNGHFNSIQGITHAILRGGIYDDLILLPMAMYYWNARRWLPLLASSWGFDQGADTFTVKLNSGLVWSDGNPITSKVVVSTLWAERIVRNVVWQLRS